MSGSYKFIVFALVLVTISVMLVNVAGDSYDSSDDSSCNEDEVRNGGGSSLTKSMGAISCRALWANL